MKKHNLMYSIFGMDKNHKCRECRNFIKYRPTSRCVSKCVVYGVSGSEATDWNGRKAACGHFNKPNDKGNNIIRLARRSKVADYKCDGQMSLEG